MSFIKKIKIIYVLLLIFIAIAAYFNFTKTGEQQFSLLARSFLQGKLYFVDNFGSWGDAVLYNDHYYWPQGFLPAVILIPFTYLFNGVDIFFYQGYLSFFLGLIILFLIYKIAKKYKYSDEDSIYWAFAFVFGTAFIGLYMRPWSWYFAQVVTVVLLFWLIYEYLSKKRYWVLFLLAFLVLLTRVTAGLGAFLFLAFEIIFLKERKVPLLKTFSLLILFGLFGIFILGVYNFARFGNFFDSGYMFNSLPPETSKAREYGIFSLIHVPSNLYFALINTPLPVLRDNMSVVLRFPFLRPSPWGMSVLVTSPYLIYLFFLNYKNRFSMIIILAILLALVPIITYYGVGYKQFGYRYLLDVMPFVFLLFMNCYQQKKDKITIGLKMGIALSGIFNLYLFLTYVNVLK